MCVRSPVSRRRFCEKLPEKCRNAGYKLKRPLLRGFSNSLKPDQPRLAAIGFACKSIRAVIPLFPALLVAPALFLAPENLRVVAAFHRVQNRLATALQ